MGLDMYLSKKTYVRQWSHKTPEEQFQVEVKKGNEPYEPILTNRVSYITEEVGYWRKFNALHIWFVENVQDGRDECQESYVSEEKLEELRNTLQEVKKIYEEETPNKRNKLEELFPTSSGFFFGSTSYDDYYIEQVNETIELLENLLKEEGGDYYYQSSW